MLTLVSQPLPTPQSVSSPQILLCKVYMLCILVAVPAQPTRVYISEPLPTPQSVSCPTPTVEEPALAVNLSKVPNGTLGKCALSKLIVIHQITLIVI